MGEIAIEPVRSDGKIALPSAAIALIKEKDFGVPIQFTNYRG